MSGGLFTVAYLPYYTKKNLSITPIVKLSSYSLHFYILDKVLSNNLVINFFWLKTPQKQNIPQKGLEDFHHV